MFQGIATRASLFVMETLGGLRKGERGQGIMEYSILLGAIALIAAIALFATGGLSFANMRNSIQDCINFEATTCRP